MILNYLVLLSINILNGILTLSIPQLRGLNILVYYISSIYSPFSVRVELPLHNIPLSGVLMKSIGAEFYDWMSFLAPTTCVECSIK